MDKFLVENIVIKEGVRRSIPINKMIIELHAGIADAISRFLLIVFVIDGGDLFH